MNLSNRLQKQLSLSAWGRSDVASKPALEINLSQELEKLALILAQTWKDEHPGIDLSSQAAFESCVSYITKEMAIAGAAVGGPAGLAILTGSGSAAARVRHVNECFEVALENFFIPFTDEKRLESQVLGCRNYSIQEVYLRIAGYIRDEPSSY